MSARKSVQGDAEASGAPSPGTAALVGSLAATVAFTLMPLFGALSSYVQNITPSASTVLRSVVALMLLGLAIFATVLSTFRPRSVALAVAPALAVCFGVFGAIGHALGIEPWTWSDKAYGLAYLIASVALVRIIRKASREFQRVLPQALAVASLVAAMTSVATVAPRFTERFAENYPLDPLPAVDTRVDAGRLPDVYHVVFDGLGRADALAARYGLDLTPVVGALRQRGFEVSRSGITNYNQTYLSLASMLNATYLDGVAAELPGESSREPMDRLIQHSRILEWFKKAGYEFVLIGGGYIATEVHRLADECLCRAPLIGEFESGILTTSPFRLLRTGGLDFLPYRQRILTALSELETIRPSGRPRIVFAHIMAPRPPFVIGAQGESRHPRRTFTITDGTTFQGSNEEYVVGYREQTQYIARRIPSIVDRFEAASDRDSVIIVHGDHGPRMHVDADVAERTDPNESMPVFLAIRWAPSAATASAPVVSLVNVYREYFRRYVDQSITPLEDRAFVSSFTRPYRFLEVPLRHLSEQPLESSQATHVRSKHRD